MLAALTAAAQTDLSRQFSDRTVSKVYEAILEGVPSSDFGEIKTLICRDPVERKKMKVSSGFGREAVTRYRVLEKYRQNSLVEFEILTGRTHQIRVHAKYLGHPVVGDKSYGFKKQRFSLASQLLHARQITFFHPSSHERLTFSARHNDEFARILNLLRSEL
jgi:23S rRNA pseudouridine1911/1915/1917 synthase